MVDDLPLPNLLSTGFPQDGCMTWIPSARKMIHSRLSDQTDSTWKGSKTWRKFPMWLTEMVSFKTPFSYQTERFSQLNRASTQITPLKCQRQSKKVWKPRPLCLTHSHGAERALKLESRLTVRELRVWEIYCDKKAVTDAKRIPQAQFDSMAVHALGCVYPCFSSGIYDSTTFREVLDKSFFRPVTQGLLCPTAPASLRLNKVWVNEILYLNLGGGMWSGSSILQFNFPVRPRFRCAGWLNDLLPPPSPAPTSCHYHPSWFKDFYVASWEKLLLADYIIPRQVILQWKGP